MKWVCKVICVSAALAMCSGCAKEPKLAALAGSQQVASINWDDFSANGGASISPAKNSFLIMMR